MSKFLRWYREKYQNEYLPIFNIFICPIYSNYPRLFGSELPVLPKFLIYFKEDYPILLFDIKLDI